MWLDHGVARLRVGFYGNVLTTLRSALWIGHTEPLILSRDISHIKNIWSNVKDKVYYMFMGKLFPLECRLGYKGPGAEGLLMKRPLAHSEHFA